MLANHLHGPTWKFLIAGAGALLFALGCSPTRRISRQLDTYWESPSDDYQFTGLLLVDAASGDTLYKRNEKRAFTPASNVKLFTLYAALKTLPEQIPALKYTVRGDTLLVVGTGNPAALHPGLQDSSAYVLMRTGKHLAMVNGHMEDLSYGPGWAWDDYDRSYMPRKSAFPLFGNTLRVWKGTDSLRVAPAFLRDSVVQPSGQTHTATGHPFRREAEGNRFYVDPSPADTLEVPFVTNPEIERQFWSAVLGKRVYQSEFPKEPLQVLPGLPADSLYKRMMKESDNFVAEQLMLVVSSTLGDTLSFSRARDFTLDSLLSDIPRRPRWVDGSGLSRYNLFSPETLVYLLGKLYREFPRERLFSILASGGQRGTLQNRFRDPDRPYLYGKTGTLSNNHNLSGYLLTRSGRTVIFSFMNNHYQEPTSQVAFRMERLLKWVRDQY